MATEYGQLKVSKTVIKKGKRKKREKGNTKKTRNTQTKTAWVGTKTKLKQVPRGDKIRVGVDQVAYNFLEGKLTDVRD